MSSPEPLPSYPNPTPASPPVVVVVVVPATPPPQSALVKPTPVLPPPMQLSFPAPMVPTLPPPLPVPVPSLPPPVMPPEIIPASPPPALPLPLPLPSPDPAFIPVPPMGLTTPPPPLSSSSPTTTPPPPSSSSENPPARSPPPPPPHSTHHRSPPSTANSNSTMSDASSVLSRNLPLTIGITAVAVALLMMLGFGLMYWICSRKKKKQPPRPLYQADHPPPPHAVGVGDLSYHGGSMHPANRLQPVPRLSPKGMERVPSAMASPGTPGAQPVGFWTPAQPHIPSNKSNMSLSDSFRNGGFNNHSSFTYDELAAATGGFSNATVIGHGGFGYVYKGVLANGREVAVKCLKSGAKQGDREFQAEVETISRVHHRHLVSLVGYCIEGGQRILVYDFVPNKSLDYHLHGKDRPCMEWGVRLRIALGAAKGLAYLHEDCHPRVIHRDIKASNTLLDMNFEAKVADFGLAKLTTDNYTHVSTRIMGTFGYLAPEYASTGKLTEKSDVFSFGVMLLELITGRRPYDTANKFLEDSLIDWARPEIEKALDERNFTRLVDPRLEGNYVPQEMARMVACAGACIRHSAKLRPKMSQVVRVLERDSVLEELNDWTKLTEAQRSSSNDYGTSSFENMRSTPPPATKPALKSSSSSSSNNQSHRHHNSNDDSREFASSGYGGATTSEYGLDPSSSSSSSDNESDEVAGKKRSNMR